MLQQRGSTYRTKALLGIAALTALAAFERPAAAAPGAVYTMTNAAAGNAVVMYSRSWDGTLGAPKSFPTGGLGTGAGLGSQGALIVSAGGHWLLAANAGSNDVTVFEAGEDRLTVMDRQPSGGVMPVSIAVSRNLVFVLNAGGAANITGFWLTPRGRLVPLPRSTRVLPGAAPAQVSFAERGDVLAITEKGSNTITLYKVDDGRIEGPFTHSSAGQTPFGFDVSKMDLLIVSEAAGGAPGASTVSSYELDDDGSLRPVTSALPTGQTAACWVAVSDNGKYGYVANTGSSTISSVAISRGGSLRLLSAVAGETPPGTPAIDLAFSAGSRYLYALAGPTISVFRVQRDGSLEHLQVVSGIPASAAGLSAR